MGFDQYNNPLAVIAIGDDTTTNASMYPLFATTTSGDLPLYASSTKFKFNPSSGLLTVTALTVGTLAGVIKGTAGAFSAATAGTDYVVGSTGLAGGQTIAGGTLTTQNLTLRANAADTTTGQVNITSSLEASSTTVASLTTAGGFSAAKKAYFGTSVNTPIIANLVDGTAGLKITKADGATAIMTFDSTNVGVGIGCAPNAAAALTVSAKSYLTTIYTDILNPLSGFGLGVGVAASASATMKVKAGSTTVASMLIASGAKQTTPVAGCVYSDGTHLYWVNDAGSERQLDA